ncbi:MAG: PH domain-containing protein [Deltaproteobacteria bacterium]|nr:PH domain-containing protein [Deltaproteobacteria bacterium]
MSGKPHLKLLAGEECFTEAVPIRGIYARKSWPLSLLGLPFLLVAGILIYLWFNYEPVTPGAELVRMMMLLSAAPFLFLGLFLALGLFVLFYLEAPAVLYTVTSRRIIIRRGIIVQKEFEIFVDNIAGLKVIHHGGTQKAGTIQFMASGSTPGAPFYLKRFPTEKFRGEVSYAIEAVADVDSVRFHIEKAIDQRRRVDTVTY